MGHLVRHRGGQEPGPGQVEQAHGHQPRARRGERLEQRGEAVGDRRLVEPAPERVVAARDHDREVGPEGERPVELRRADLGEPLLAHGEVAVGERVAAGGEGVRDAVRERRVAVAVDGVTHAERHAVADHHEPFGADVAQPFGRLLGSQAVRVRGLGRVGERGRHRATSIAATGGADAGADRRGAPGASRMPASTTPAQAIAAIR